MPSNVLLRFALTLKPLTEAVAHVVVGYPVNSDIRVGPFFVEHFRDCFQALVVASAVRN